MKPGQSLALVGENGSGKTTLIKLLTRLYVPSSGRILLDGLDLGAWSPVALRRRVAVIFQDFARYQLKVGENIGAGDVERFADEAQWREAAAMATAAHRSSTSCPMAIRRSSASGSGNRPRAVRRAVAEDRARPCVHPRRRRHPRARRADRRDGRTRRGTDLRAVP